MPHSIRLTALLALTLAATACSAPPNTVSTASLADSPHVFAHEHILEATATDAISDRLWAQYHKEIARLMGDTSDPRAQGTVQVMTEALAISPTKTADGLDIQTQLELFVGNIPDWGAEYVVTSRKVRDAYREILMQIQVAPDATESLRAQVDAQVKKLGDKGDTLDEQEDDLMDDWVEKNNRLQAHGRPSISWEDYIATSPHAAAYNLSREEFDNEVTSLRQLIAAIPTATSYVEALDKLNAELKAGRLTSAYDFSGNVADMIGKWTSTGAYAGQAPAGLAPQSISFNETSASTDYSQTAWRAGGGYRSWFVRAKGTASGSSESLVTKSSTYQMSINFAAAQRVVATPRTLNATLLEEYKDGPWLAGSLFDQKIAKPYGEGGLMPMWVTEFLVVLNPTITMKLDDSTYQYSKQSMSVDGGGSYGWGPFGYSGSGSYSSTHVKTDYHDANGTITITDTSNIPKIVAVRSHLAP